MKKGMEIFRSRTERMAAQYRNGASLDEVGERFGITRERVRRILEQIGCPRRAMTVTDKFLQTRRKPEKWIEREILVELYEKEKLSLNEIKRRLKTTTVVIYRSLELHGIKRRSDDENKERLKKHPELNRETLYKLYVEEDMSAAAIGENYGYAAQTTPETRRWNNAES